MKRIPLLNVVMLVMLLTAVLIVVAPVGLEAADTAAADEWGERQDGGYYRLVDLDGKFVTETSLDIGVDDVYISEDNVRYVIDRVSGDTVYARNEGQERMPAIYDQQGAVVAFWQWAAGMASGNKGAIGIYQTHSDESYQPTSGTTSATPRGDIYEVGKALAASLEKAGYQVVFSDNVHLPHDGQAYVRSRRTAAELSRQGPVTLIDIHRDAIPNPSQYRATVNGEQLSQVRLVVGRQNQNMATNLAYAKRIKAVADKKYPGLIKGIFFAKGNYNQDLGPRMILLEFGTHTTTLQEASKAAALMADIIPAAAGLAPGTGGTASSQFGKTGLTSALWILGLAAVGAGIWYFVNKEKRRSRS